MSTHFFFFFFFFSARRYGLSGSGCLDPPWLVRGLRDVAGAPSRLALVLLTTTTERCTLDHTYGEDQVLLFWPRKCRRA